jgi:hypothetical protein
MWVPKTDRLILGARAKIYMSPLMRLRLKLRVSIPFLPTTTKAIYSDMQLNTSNFRILPKVMMETAGDIRKKALFGRIGTWI